MSEVKTSPIKAKHIADQEQFQQRRGAGLFRVGPVGKDGEQWSLYCCPCECCAASSLSTGNGFKPAVDPSWMSSGSCDQPTLHPSVNHIGHWHGWLRNGVWESC